MIEDGVDGLSDTLEELLGIEAESDASTVFEDALELSEQVKGAMGSGPLLAREPQLDAEGVPLFAPAARLPPQGVGGPQGLAQRMPQLVVKPQAASAIDGVLEGVAGQSVVTFKYVKPGLLSQGLGVSL